MSKIEKAESAFLQAKLHALNDPEWDSSDDDDEDELEGNKVEKSVTQANASRRSTTKQAPSSTPRSAQKQQSSVLYLGHLPSQFAEHELYQFLKQFGKVQHVRVSRSKKTRNSRGYAFCEMQSPQVAAIVADTLSGYFLLGRRLVCHVVPPEKIHKKLFFHSKPKKKKAQERTLEKMKQITVRLVERERKKRQKLQDLGIEYDFPGYEQGRSVNEQQEGHDEEDKEEESKPEPADRKSKKAKKKQRKDSIESEGSSSKERKQKDSIDMAERTQSEGSRKKKKPKDSIPEAEIAKEKGSIGKTRKDSIESEGSSKKKRKNSIASVESAQSEGSTGKKKRNDSIESEGSSRKKQKDMVSTENAQPEGITKGNDKDSVAIVETTQSASKKNETRRRSDLGRNQNELGDSESMEKKKTTKKKKKKRRRQSAP